MAPLLTNVMITIEFDAGKNGLFLSVHAWLQYQHKKREKNGNGGAEEDL